MINFDAAKNLDLHVHRIGRAGQLSHNKGENNSNEQKKGVAYALLTEKNADFAKILMDAFEREGREINDDLLKLSMKSKHYGGGGRQKWNKSGLGFAGDVGDVGAGGERSGNSSSASSNRSYYGPTETANVAKHRRWDK
jgi:superfamily II DNA/RNA helicase